MSSWEDEANCLGNRDLFFCDDLEDPGEFDFSDALEICRSCDVRGICLKVGLAGREYRYGGVWGGATPDQLRRLARHSRHGRASLFCERCGTDRDFFKILDIGWRYCCD